MKAPGLTLIPLFVVVAGCAMQPYSPQPIVPDQINEAFRTRTLADAGLGEVAEWGLPELTQAALRLHPDLDVARAQWKAVQAGEKTAGQKPNPSISGGGEHHSRDSGISPWTWTLAIDIPVETHGKREARIELATALSEAARLDIGQAAWRVRSRLRAQLLEIHAVRQQISQLKKETEIRTRIVALLEARVEAGLVGGIDLTDARLQLQKVRTLLDAELARMAELRAGLAATVGLPESAMAEVPLSFAAFEQDGIELPSQEVQRAALLNRLDVLKALASYKASEARLKLEIAKQYPDFSFAPGYSWDQGDNRWSLGLSLVLALLNRNEGPIAEARAAREAEAQKFNALQAGVIGEQEQALARWQAAHEEIPRAQKLLAAQQSRLVQTQRQFDAGYADRVELTSAQLELATAEAVVLSARLKAQRMLGQLEDTVQQPLDGSAPLTEEIPPENTQENVNE